MSIMITYVIIVENIIIERARARAVLHKNIQKPGGRSPPAKLRFQTGCAVSARAALICANTARAAAARGGRRRKR